MIVGVPRFRSLSLDLMRSLVRSPKVLIYPEFVDFKRALLRGDIKGYVDRLMKLVSLGYAAVAVWPDRCYDRCLDLLRSVLDRVIWIFPLHEREEIVWVLSRFDSKVPEYVIGFPNRRDLRDYDLLWLYSTCSQHGLKMWLMGLKPRFYNSLWRFWGCDVTTFSVSGYSFDRARYRSPSISFAEIMSCFVTYLAEHGRALTFEEIMKRVRRGEFSVGQR